ncbi:hypothetical protein WICPIJ_009581 [Wickerhamomyces pijperi]|uniref:Uncharacterized protein n=1 Tax=Wickerhamomyces pijperi TaxID=599730 RepID=A0A9P8PLX6_WICPI|nr:hypothetical protein WICPIJ_009581 [Wickerhamomyces pijperi]
MNITEEISDLKTQHNLRFDENLYISLTLTLISSRHVIITTDDITKTLNETIMIIDTIWGIPASVICFDSEYQYTEAEIHQFFITGNDKLSPVYILIGLEKLSVILQKVVLQIIKRKYLKNDIEGQVYGSHEELFSFITICGADEEGFDKFYWYLRSEFWFKQHHTIQDQEQLQLPTSKEPILPDKWSSLYKLRPQIPQITILPELQRYIYDLIVHVRNHRVTHGGLPTRSIADLIYLTQALTLIFKKVSFVVPNMVKLAFRKYTPCHLRLIEKAEWEPSLRWGGDVKVAAELIRRVSVEHVVEHVLNMVSVPI